MIRDGDCVPPTWGGAGTVGAGPSIVGDGANLLAVMQLLLETVKRMVDGGEIIVEDAAIRFDGGIGSLAHKTRTLFQSNTVLPVVERVLLVHGI